MTASDQQAREARDFIELPQGWPSVVVTRAWIGQEHGYWFAIDADFDIVAQGDSAEAAEAELLELVADYLTVYLRDGVPFDQARRPVPLMTRVRLDAQVALTKLLGKRSPTPVRSDRLRLPSVAPTPC